MAPVNPDDIEQLLDDAAGGRRAALARLLSVIERGGDGARVLGRLAHPRGGQAYTVGITGAPGAGKSTLTNALCATVREAGDDYAGELADWLTERQPALISDAHWQAIDAHERSAGEPHGRPRVKLPSVERLLHVGHG